MGRKQAEAIAEGVSIALAAARLTIKNHILVDTIAEDEAFNSEHFDDVARETLEALAAEATDAAQRIRKVSRAAWGKYTQSDGTHDYRDRDVRNLRKRRKQSEGVAHGLLEIAQDPARVRALVDVSREAAWTDVSSNLDRRLRVEGMRPEMDPDYTRMREARMQALRLVDLQKLASQRKVELPAEMPLDVVNDTPEAQRAADDSTTPRS